MPTVLTHPVAALALFPWIRRAPWALLAVGAACTVLPDFDTLPRHLGFAVDGVLAHRGASHSLAFALVVAALLARAGRAAWRDVPPLAAFAFLFAATASHALLDMLTDGGPGIALLWPLHDARLFFPWRPIEVSPLDAGRFFGPRGLAVLASEAKWVWAPALATTLAGVAWRRRRGASR